MGNETTTNKNNAKKQYLSLISTIANTIAKCLSITGSIIPFFRPITKPIELTFKGIMYIFFALYCEANNYELEDLKELSTGNEETNNIVKQYLSMQQEKNYLLIIASILGVIGIILGLAIFAAPAFAPILLVTSTCFFLACDTFWSMATILDAKEAYYNWSNEAPIVIKDKDSNKTFSLNELRNKFIHDLFYSIYTIISTTSVGLFVASLFLAAPFPPVAAMLLTLSFVAAGSSMLAFLAAMMPSVINFCKTQLLRTKDNDNNKNLTFESKSNFDSSLDNKLNNKLNNKNSETNTNENSETNTNEDSKKFESKQPPTRTMTWITQDLTNTTNNKDSTHNKPSPPDQPQ